jgi:hypothetical protein
MLKEVEYPEIHERLVFGIDFPVAPAVGHDNRHSFISSLVGAQSGPHKR